MRSTVRLLAAVAAALTVSTAAQAQSSRPVELGADAGLDIGFGDVSTTAIGIPVPQIRAGFFLRPNVSLEPYGSFAYTKIEDFDTTELGLGVGLLWHFRPSTTGPYLRPFLQLDYASADFGDLGDDSETQVTIGAGLGTKVPITERLAWRFEGNLGYNFDAEAAQLGVRAGISLFTR